MQALGTEHEYSPRNASRASTNAWHVYGRLLRYAWTYKFRLILSLFFAIVVAVSFGSMIFATGAIVKTIFAKERILRFHVEDEAISGDLRAFIEGHNAIAGPPEPIDDGRYRVVLREGDVDVPALCAEFEARGAANVMAFPEDIEAAAENVRDAADTIARVSGLRLKDLDERFLAVAGRMRARKMLALLVLSGALIALTFIGGIARFLQEYYAGSISAYITVQLMQEMYENIVRLSLTFFERRPTGELLARFTNDVFMVNRGLSGAFVKLLREPFKVVVFLALALRVDTILTLVGVCVLPPAIYVIVLIGKKVKKYVRRSLERVANFASLAKETFTGILIVKGFGMEKHQVARVDDELTRLRKYLKRTVQADAAVGPLSEFVMVLGIVVFILLSGRRVEAGLMDSGDVVMLYFALAAMLDPLRKLAAVNNAIQTSVASAERVFEFIDAEPDLVEAPDAVALARLERAVEFRNVSFRYPGKDDVVLRDISFTVPKGHMVALVGFSGAGKTTIAKLIPRFYDPDSGTISVDGVDIRRATLSSLRDQIGIVTQQTILFDESVRANIACGHTEYSDERIADAARIAQATAFIERLPDGYNTRIGETGGTLSGGQRQRLAIARALARDPAILILDEATSSLDSESERAIQRAIEESIVGRTTVIIAHRLSTILRADQILVVDEGRVVERGTHQELLRHGGLYSRLYEVQFASEQSGGRS
ncbi:MAG TPA: ABC transporter ATP-binding protein [Candidatus Hydrogenedentes bacterium]|nr:ABC transporter ATP-binding protein [Candidatus Hydrogenedentota bacterium]